ncbi:TPA: hypothetical protein ACH3X1_006757 [Trebouxia sp. C0004]
MVQVKKMLHANRPKRVKNACKAQVQPGDLEALPDLVCNQEEFDECVNEWLYDLELEGLTSGKERDVTQNGIVVKAPLAATLGTTLEVLSDSNVAKF